MRQKNQARTKATNATPEREVTTTTRADEPTTEDRIRQRAYEIYMARGGNPGQYLDDWLQAEREIEAELQRVPNSHP